METDLTLLSAARKMDQEAIVRIFDLYASRLYNYAMRLGGDPVLADHVVGDVFARLVEQLVAGKGPTLNLRSYLYEMAYHLIVDESRSSNRRAPLESLAALRPDFRAGQLGSEEQIMLEKVLFAIRHELTIDQRHVIILRFLEDFSVRETAAILGKSINHVKVIQSRALARLRKVFEQSERKARPSLSRLEDASRAFSP